MIVSMPPSGIVLTYSRSAISTLQPLEQTRDLATDAAIVRGVCRFREPADRQYNGSCPCLCCWGKKGGLEQALGRSRGGFSTKIHVLADGLGNPLELALTGGQTHDVTQALGLLIGKQADRVIADRSYDADPLIEQIKQQGAEAVIPPRNNRKQGRAYDRHSYKERHLIECLFGKLKQYRRIFSRFDKQARNYWSFLCFACTLIWLR
ncbi:MAG: IS5 family transposase [Myxacorys californica WJT36-NPBG1]|nr:IS5 family transposase [Myxacorys californica WJT36-NPBG1]